MENHGNTRGKGGMTRTPWNGKSKEGDLMQKTPHFLELHITAFTVWY